MAFHASGPSPSKTICGTTPGLDGVVGAAAATAANRTEPRSAALTRVVAPSYLCVLRAADFRTGDPARDLLGRVGSVAGGFRVRSLATQMSSFFSLTRE